jgi:hypothetical protein
MKSLGQKITDGGEYALPALLFTVYVAFLVLLVLTAIRSNTAIAKDLHDNVTIITAALAGLVVNPTPQGDDPKPLAGNSVLWHVAALAGATAVVLCLIQVFSRSTEAPVLALLAAVSAFTTLFIDSSHLITPKK